MQEMTMEGAATEQEIAVGTVVRHGLSGPSMTVALIDSNEAVCEWFEGTALKRDVFAVSELSVVPSESAAGAAPRGEDDVALPADDGEMPWPSEVLTAFAHWLTTREERSGPFGRHYEAEPAAVLVDRFSKSQGYAPPRDDFKDRFRPYPQD